jgi:ribose 5-phosphate isomerase B
MMIGLGSDHLGFALKEQLVSFLTQRSEKVHDFGTFSDEPTDYPDVAVAVAEAVQAGLMERGILVCGTGLGMAIAANKVPGILAAPVTDPYTAQKARESNNAQIITLGANIVGRDLACRIVEAWLKAEFRGGPSARKVGKILALEQRYRQDAGYSLPGGGLRC